MNLKSKMKEKGLTIKQLSEMSDVPTRTIETVLQSKSCRIETAMKLAMGLNMSLDELCDFNKYKEKHKKTIQIKDLEGQHKLSGVDYMPSTRGDRWSNYSNDIVFCLDGQNYIMTEDESDGYRSYMTELEITNRKIRNTFPDQDVLCKYLEECDNEYCSKVVCEILEIYSLDGKLIMRSGTENTNDYYPYTVFEYHPENMDINKGVKLENDDSK